MPVLVKLISQGVGLATEAYASSKKSKAAKAAAASSSSSSPSRSVDEPPQYAELPDDQATDLIANGRAVPIDEAGSAHKQEQDPVAAPAVLDDDDVWALDEASEERRHQHDHHHHTTSARSNSSSSSPSPPGTPLGSEKPDISNNVLIRDLLSRLPPPLPLSTAPRLPCPVILPQRRPREKTRGFVRAYAPVLQDAAGIDQASFLAFLKSFHAASQASPIFNVILLANAAVGFVPSVAVMATTAAVNAVVIPAQIAQQRYRANTFLDEANERLFKPRGLFAMIVAFKGDDRGKPVEAKQLDINAVFAKYGGSPGESSSGSKWKDGARKMRLSSGKTYGEEGLPVAADLVFPGLEEEEGEGGEQAEGMKGKKKWLADYYDRRAQATFLAENPDSSLIKQKPEFASSWADPSHPAYQGTLVTLVSGGKIPPRQRGVRGLAGIVSGATSSRGGREGQYQSYEGRGGLLGGRGPLSARAGAAGRGREGLLDGRGLLGRGPSPGQQDYYDGRSPSSGYGATNAYAGEQGYYEDASHRRETESMRSRQQASRGGSSVAARGGRTTIIGTVKKALRQDVLYLMIVNMPTEEEMAHAQAQLEELQAQTSSG